MSCPLDQRLVDAYLDYATEQVRAGILDCWTDAAAETGETMDEHMVKVLREAGRLPEGYEEQAQ